MFGQPGTPLAASSASPPVSDTERARSPSTACTTVFLGVVVTALVVTNWSAVAENAFEFAPAFIVLNLAGLAVGYGVSKAFGLDRRQSSTIGVETGVQNSTLALTIAVSVLGNNELAILPGPVPDPSRFSPVSVRTPG